MSKYSAEFKLKVVMFCIEGNYGYQYTAKHFNIPTVSDVTKWVRKKNCLICKAVRMYQDKDKYMSSLQKMLEKERKNKSKFLRNTNKKPINALKVLKK